MTKQLICISIILLAVFHAQPVKAEQKVKYKLDSIPPITEALFELHNNPTAYLALFDKTKREIDAQKGDKTFILYSIYKNRNTFHYNRYELDSLKKYIPIAKELCLKVNDMLAYYAQWNILCEMMHLKNDEALNEESQKMYNDALSRKNDIGMAFCEKRLALEYATKGENQKAQTYFQNSMLLFKKCKHWDSYIPAAANYIIILNNLEQMEKAREVFLSLDSLANSFIKSNQIKDNAERILVIKDIAALVYKEKKDSLTVKKYIKEMEAVYKEVPDLPYSYLYNAKRKYAVSQGNYAEAALYQDSCGQIHLKNKNIPGLLASYSKGAEYLGKAHKYKEAYLLSSKYISLKDSTSREDFRQQLNELSTRFDVNKLELKAERARLEAQQTQYYYACALIVLLVAALFVSIRFYRQKTKSNRLLQKKAHELTHANEKLHRAQLMKSAFIQNMNHEIRTPLNAIVGFSECLTSMPMEPEEAQEMNGVIKKNSDLLLKIINDIISISNIDSDESELDFQRISLNTLCNGVVMEMIALAPPEVKLRYLPGKEDYMIMSDMSTAQQIISNLLHNALKFTEKGEVELSYQIDEERQELHLYVRDTGPGISSEFKEKIFERFYKIDNFAQGAGLGLSLCRILAKRLGAQIYLDDSYRKGCRFVFTHPLK